MTLALLTIALVAATVFVGVAVYCAFSEATEAWDISRSGWVRGHHAHRMVRVHRHGR